MNKKKQQRSADFMLTLVVICCGFSFFLTDIATSDLEAFNLNAFRFIIAFIVGATIFNKKLHNVSRATLKWSLILGCILAIMYACMNLGVKYTTLSNSGFLCQTTVIVIPFLSAIINKTKPGLKVYIVAAICMISVALLTLSNGFSINSSHIKGDIFCLVCGVAYAVHIVVTERVVNHPEVDLLQLSIIQLGTTGVISLLSCLVLETPHFPTVASTWAAALFLSIMCTGFSFVIQTIAQKYTSASHVGVIFSLEPVIAGFVAFAFAGDVMTVQGYLGAILMVAGVFIMEIDFKATPYTECFATKLKEKDDDPS